MKRAFFLILILASLASLAWASRAGWLELLGDGLVLDTKPVKSDLIIVLSGAAMNERIRYGARLWREGFAPKVLLSGHMNLEPETGIDLMKQYTLMLGVPEKDILREPESQTTQENAARTRELVENLGASSVLVVTSPTHTRRAHHLFRNLLPASVRVVTVADPGIFPRNSWWQHSRFLREVCYEYLNFFWLGILKAKGEHSEWD